MSLNNTLVDSIATPFDITLTSSSRKVIRKTEMLVIIPFPVKTLSRIWPK